jgi:hypothetical protein
MKRHTQWRQLGLLDLATNEVPRPQLDPIVRREIVSLLKQLFIDYSAGAFAKTKEASDE